MRKATRNRSDGLLEQVNEIGRQWSKLRGRFTHRETKHHGRWIWKELVYDPVRACLRRMKTAGNLHFRKERAPKKTYPSPNVSSASGYFPSKKTNALFPFKLQSKRNAGTSILSQKGKYPEPTKPYMGRHPSQYCRIAELLINNASKVIQYGRRVVDKITPAEKVEN